MSVIEQFRTLDQYVEHLNLIREQTKNTLVDSYNAVYKPHIFGGALPDNFSARLVTDVCIENDFVRKQIEQKGVTVFPVWILAEDENTVRQTVPIRITGEDDEVAVFYNDDFVAWGYFINHYSRNKMAAFSFFEPDSVDFAVGLKDEQQASGLAIYLKRNPHNGRFEKFLFPVSFKTNCIQCLDNTGVMPSQSRFMKIAEKKWDRMYPEEQKAPQPVSLEYESDITVTDYVTRLRDRISTLSVHSIEEGSRVVHAGHIRGIPVLASINNRSGAIDMEIGPCILPVFNPRSEIKPIDSASWDKYGKIHVMIEQEPSGHTYLRAEALFNKKLQDGQSGWETSHYPPLEQYVNWGLELDLQRLEPYQLSVFRKQRESHKKLLKGERPKPTRIRRGRAGHF